MRISRCFGAKRPETEKPRADSGYTEGLTDSLDLADAPTESGLAAGGAPPSASAPQALPASNTMGPTLAGIEFQLVRRILQDLHEGKGRRAFERVPHGKRAQFKRDFLAAIRDRPALAGLRARVEAALRER